MTVKTLTAPSLSAALAEARRLYGDDVVLLESHPPAGNRPARVTIAAEPARTVSADAASISRVIDRVKQQPQPAYGYAAAGSSVDLMVEDDADEADFSVERPSSRGRARGRLFPSDGRPLRSDEPVAAQEVTRTIEQLLEQRLGTLHDRLEGIERRFEGHPASAGKWLRHPLFNRLLDRGLHPQTVTELFFNATTDSDFNDEDALYWGLVRSMRDMLQASAPVRPVGPQVFIGAGGSGKTSLILQLATDRSFYGRRRCGVIILNPSIDDDRLQRDDTETYRRAGLPVQNVTKPEDMPRALERLRGFDHVLIDTPALPFRPRPMRDMLAQLRPFAPHLVPAQTQFVLDATRALDDLDPELLRRMPVSPDVIALTHMDETSRPGRIFEWIRQASLPVNLVGSAATLSDGLSTFSPSAFAEHMLEA